MAKVSVIVPIYNVQEYLPRTVESLLNQTEKDIEIILVDDGSTDESGSICDAYAKRDPRIKVIHKENGGLSSARNAGVIIATSEYVLFLDGDDYICDDAIETIIRANNLFQTDVVQFLYKEVAETVQQMQHEVETWSAFVESRPKELFQCLYRFGGVAASCCTKLIKRQLVLDYPFESIRHEDEMWCTRVFPEGIRIAYIPDILYCYVKREDSIIHSKFNPSKLDVFKVQEERIRTLNTLALSDLAEKEYSKMFLTMLLLYCDAFRIKDDLSCRIVKNQFDLSKENLLKSKYIRGKYRILLILMTINFSFVFLFIRHQKA